MYPYTYLNIYIFIYISNYLSISFVLASVDKASPVMKATLP